MRQYVLVLGSKSGTFALEMNQFRDCYTFLENNFQLGTGIVPYNGPLTGYIRIVPGVIGLPQAPGGIGL